MPDRITDDDPVPPGQLRIRELERAQLERDDLDLGHGWLRAAARGAGAQGKAEPST
jgi:hypothetical protein